MQNNALFLPQAIYLRYLIVMDGIHFTRREIDVMACLLYARSTGKIASLLDVAPTTVTTHITNIMEKLKCHSRENIIDFVERSHNLATIKRHYASLVGHVVFEKSLKACSKLINKPLPSLIVYCKDQQSQSALSYHLRTHLKLAGIEVEARLQRLSPHDNKVNIENQKNAQAILIILIKEEKVNISKKSSKNTFKSPFIEFSDQKSYYLSGFEILKKLCPQVDFDRIILEFRDVYEIREESSKVLLAQAFSHESTLEKTEIDSLFLENSPYEAQNYSKKTTKWLIQIISFFKKEGLYLGAVLFIGFVGAGNLVLSRFQKNPQSKKESFLPGLEQSPIRSALVIPKESALLERSDLLMKMDDKFKGSKDHKELKVLALVGMGGAGKTTLARHYARNQNASVVWEINAETKESLMISFEELAYALSQSQEEKSELKKIQAVKNPDEKEKQLLLFVKEKLRSRPGWFLIYDNLEKFSNIFKYFHYQISEWGKGNILITTRDETLQNTSYINVEHVMPLQELKKEEAFELFTKILYTPHSFPFDQKEGIVAFLQNIPSFPLDISIAAYYIKNSRITLEEYLERISQPSQQFEAVQEAITKEMSHYAKTRYNIIALSLQQLIKTDPAFADLCLFISLLDSQNIPRAILDKYKNPIVVDNFIYNLKKYSLIIPESPISVSPHLSLHRSIQKMMLTYFLGALSLEEGKEKTQHMASIMEGYADTIIDKEDFLQARFLINHYEAFLSHKHLLKDSIIPFMKGELGNIYNCLRNFIKAKQLLEEASETFDKDYKDYRRILKFLTSLAKAYVESDDTQEMRKLCDRLLKIYNDICSKDDVHSALILTSLGDMHDSLADYKTAQNLLEQSLAIYKKSHPDRSLKEAHILGILGTTCMKIGDYKKAKGFIEEGLALHQKFLPQDHFRIGWMLICLGNTYIGLGNYPKAKELIEAGIVIYKKHFSEDHTSTAWSSVYLANLHTKLQNYKEAQELLEKSLKIYKKNFSKSHEGIIRGMVYLADAYMGLEDHKKARIVLEEALAIEKQRYGEEHIKIAETLQRLGKIYLEEDQIETASPLTHKALKMFLKNKHPESYACLEDLADISLKKSSLALTEGFEQQSQELKKQAIDYLKKALETIKTHGLELSPHFTRIQSKLSNLMNNLQ
jgi:tetratricopeptide (TPR) repeat protein/DNA-binding CsgD family transcriptional regulator